MLNKLENKIGFTLLNKVKARLLRSNLTGFTPLNPAKPVRSNLTGFTLIDLIISISIIALITTITFANFRSGQVSGELNLAAQKLANDIRRAQSMAMSLKKYGGNIPAGGWGVYFNKDDASYILYADKNEDIICTSNCDSNSDEDFLTVDLPKKIYIASVSFTAEDTPTNYSTVNKAQITFLPPDPIMYICRNNTNQCGDDGFGNPGIGISATITISNGIDNKIISINQFGLVDIQ